MSSSPKYLRLLVWYQTWAWKGPVQPFLHRPSWEGTQIEDHTPLCGSGHQHMYLALCFIHICCCWLFKNIYNFFFNLSAYKSFHRPFFCLNTLPDHLSYVCHLPLKSVQGGKKFIMACHCTNCTKVKSDLSCLAISPQILLRECPN